MAIQHDQFFIDARGIGSKATLNKRLEDSGWGFFLLMIGTLLMLPSDLVPQGAWLIGAGLIMLGLNGIRYINGISVSRFTTVLGFISVLVGLASFFGLRPPLFAIFLAIVGLSIIIRSLLPPRVRSNRQ